MILKKAIFGLVFHVLFLSTATFCHAQIVPLNANRSVYTGRHLTDARLAPKVQVPVNKFIRRTAFQAYPTPTACYDTWFTYGAFINETNVYQQITNAWNAGANQLFPGGFVIMGDSGIISSNLGPNGLLQVNTNAFPHGLAGLVACAHQHGMRYVQMLQANIGTLGYSSENGSMNISQTNLYADATNLAMQGVDGFRIDSCYLTNYLTFYNAFISVSTNKNIWTGMHEPADSMTQTNLYEMPPNSYVMYEIGGDDFINLYAVFHGTNWYGNTLTFGGEGFFQSPGRLLSPVWIPNNRYWPLGQNTFNLACMFSGDLFFMNEYGQWNQWTQGVTVNPDTLLVDRDQLGMFPQVIATSYTNYDVIEKPMADGGCVLMLMTYNAVQQYSVEVNFTNLDGPIKIKQNEPILVEDLNWNSGTNVLNDDGGGNGTNEASMPSQWTWATNTITLTAHLSPYGDTTYGTNLVWPILRLFKRMPADYYPGTSYSAVASRRR